MAKAKADLELDGNKGFMMPRVIEPAPFHQHIVNDILADKEREEFMENHPLVMPE